MLFLHKTDIKQYMIFISTSIRQKFCVTLACGMRDKAYINIDVSGESTIDRGFDSVGT